MLNQISDSLLSAMSRFVKTSMSDYCELEVTDGDHNLVTHDGSLITLLKINGIGQMVGNEEYQRITTNLSLALESYMSTNGHFIQIVFERDPENSKREIRTSLSAAYQAAKNLQLDIQDLLDERVSNLSNFCATESLVLALWTRNAGLTKEEAKRDAKRKKELFKQRPYITADAQNIYAATEALRENHNSFVEAFYQDLRKEGMITNILPRHEAIRTLRKQIVPDFTDQDWSPCLVGDRVPLRIEGAPKRDASNVLWPPLGWQLFPRDVERVNKNTLQVGKRLYAPMFISLPPQEVFNFMRLFGRVESSIPWRISFSIEGSAEGGFGTINFKDFVASILSFTGTVNKQIHAAVADLKQRFAQNDTIVMLKISFCTWAPASEPDLLESRRTRLARAVQGWGKCETREEAGDPFFGWISTLPAINHKSIATACAAPLKEVVAMLPSTRPASHWDKGAILYRTPEGKLWPYQPGSSKQTTWIDLIFASPGQGKSVLLGMSNIALCLSDGNKRLPLITIIDIGPSSKGMISLLRDALPDNKRHLVIYHRMRMNKEDCINPFDTQLGARFPTFSERMFLVNLLTLLATPIGRDKPYENTAELASMVIDEMYKNLSDDEKPNLFSFNVDPLVDNAIKQHNIHTDPHTTWWEITDALFEKGDVRASRFAQRHAVPLLVDAIQVCSSKESVKTTYGEQSGITTDTGEPLYKSFMRMIAEAIRTYPILSAQTRLDFSSARIISIDLNDVAKIGGPASDRQTAVMYMLARYICASNYYITEDILNSVPEQYRAFHQQRVQETREDTKRICYEEFHRTGNSPSVREQVVVDMREGRKWGVQITLLSQSIADFDENMRQFATSIYILDASDASTVEKLSQMFGMSPTETTVLRSNKIHGPIAGVGSSFMLRYKVKDGIFTQLLTSTIGPIEAWALSTTNEDVLLRERIEGMFGSSQGRRILSMAYPKGSAKDDIERRKSEMVPDGLVDDDVIDGIIDQVAQEIADKYRLSHLSAAAS